MKVNIGGAAKTLGGDIVDLAKALPGFAADKAGQAWGAAKKRAVPTGQRMNMIWSVQKSTCEDRFMVMAETAIPAAGKALWMILVPQPSEILEEAVQPKGGRGSKGKRRDKKKRRRRGKNGKRRKRFRGIIPNTNALVAAVIPGAAARASRVPGAGEKLAWFAWDRLELVAYWLLVIDAWETFIYEWSSGIMEARFCEGPQEIVLHADIAPGTLQYTGMWFGSETVDVLVAKGGSFDAEGYINLAPSQQPAQVSFAIEIDGEIEDSTFPGDVIEITAMARRTNEAGDLETAASSKTTVTTEGTGSKGLPYAISFGGQATSYGQMRFLIRAVAVRYGGILVRQNEKIDFALIGGSA